MRDRLLTGLTRHVVQTCRSDAYAFYRAPPEKERESLAGVCHSPREERARAYLVKSGSLLHSSKKGFANGFALFRFRDRSPNDAVHAIEK